MAKSKYYPIISVVALFLAAFFLFGCGKTIHKEKRDLTNNYVEFEFDLEQSDKNYAVYFTYYYKGSI